jgi:peptidyl-prolyl cis-trans isomerase B (cyclophilin B)
MIASASLLFAVIAAAPKPVIAPEFLYNGVNRPISVRVEPNTRARKLSLRLQEPETGKIFAEVEIRRGTVQLDKIFSGFWNKYSSVIYAQVVGDGKPMGQALVMQPMTNPAVATLDPVTKNPKWDADEDNINAGYRCWVNQNVILDTNMGEIEFRMRPDVAPNTVFNFVQLVAGGYYRDVIFHRIVQKGRKGGLFVAQAGDPTGSGMGSPGYSLVLEKSSLPHDFGVLGMARSSDPNTAGSQFYIALGREDTAHLDGRYTTFAQIVRGQEVVKAIATVKIGPKDDRPIEPPIIRSARFAN